MGSLTPKMPEIPKYTPPPTVESKPPPPVPAVAAPVAAENAEVVAAGDAMRRKIRSQKGRTSTFLVPVGKMTPKLAVGDV